MVVCSAVSGALPRGCGAEGLCCAPPKYPPGAIGIERPHSNATLGRIFERRSQPPEALEESEGTVQWLERTGGHNFPTVHLELIRYIFRMQRQAARSSKRNCARAGAAKSNATYTGEKDVTLRLETILRLEGIRVAILRSSVPTDKREDWYERQLG